MITSSRFKKFAGINKNKITKVNPTINIKNTQDNIMPTHIKLNSPSLKATQSCNEHSYNIERSINTDIKNLPTSPSVISFCIYRIITCKNRSKPPHPFLQYLLYKYPQTEKGVSDLMVFPFIKYKSGAIKTIAKSTTKKLTNQDLTIKGFIENGEQLFLFFDLQEKESIPIQTVNYKNRDKQLWWAMIDEICNSREVINFPIHHSVYKIFYYNPALIYLMNKEKRLPIPKVGYYGNYYKFIPIIAAIGSQNSIRGQLSNSDLFYFSTFRKAVRYATWSPLYKERIAYNKKVTDIDGKYNEGGVVRFALFIEKILVPKDNSYEKLGKLLSKSSEWKERYDTLYFGSIDYDSTDLTINPEYILTHPEQYISLSYHMMDMKTITPNWEPSYNGYKIV